MLERIEPQDGQVSVWDFPRTPQIEAVKDRLKVVYQGVTLAATNAGYRVIEKYLAPTYYFPSDDVQTAYLQAVDHATYCKHTGTATYYDIVINHAHSEKAAWTYADPRPAYQAIAGYIAFYPSRVTACYIGEEQAHSQLATYYGGWITRAIVGPFAGDPDMGF